MNKHRQPLDIENSKCSDCDIPIWIRQGIYTCYHGKASEDNLGNPQSYYVMDIKDNSIFSKIVCNVCFIKYKEIK